MPISIQVSQGLLTEQGEHEVFSHVADALLSVHGLTGNRFMTPNVIGHLVVSPASGAYVNGRPQSLALIEVKVPSVTFPNHQIQRAFIEKVTDIIDQFKADTHPRERTYVNVTYTVDGAWGIGGQAYSNEQLGIAIQQA